MLTQTQKTAIRRHMGAPYAGTAQAGRLYGWRFTWYREDLEYRMNNLLPPEEQQITGVSLGSFRIAGRPTVGDVLSFGVGDSGGNHPFIYTVQASDFLLPPNPVNPSESSPLYAIALNAALAGNAALANLGYAAVGVMPADLFSPAYLAPYFAELMIQGPTFQTFSISGACAGTTNLTVENPGTVTPVRVSYPDPVTNVNTPLYGYIALLDVLAMGPALATLTLWLQQAGAVKFRMNEVDARNYLYRHYAHEMERCLGGEEYVKKFGKRGGGGGAVA